MVMELALVMMMRVRVMVTFETITKTGAPVNGTVDFAVYNIGEDIASLHLMGIQLWPIHVQLFPFEPKQNKTNYS